MKFATVSPWVASSGPLLANEPRVPHISLVFCEMWDSTGPSP
jgi:hypothetical protein